VFLSGWDARGINMWQKAEAGRHLLQHENWKGSVEKQFRHWRWRLEFAGVTVREGREFNWQNARTACETEFRKGRKRQEKVRL
jgi:hypothetical protein